jgi:hypothetical protein
MDELDKVLPKPTTPKYPKIEKDEELLLLEQTRKKMGFPPSAHNGGWYTGEPFHPSIAPKPIIPDIGYLTHYVMRDTDYKMHPARTYQYPGGGYRPGNYHPVLPGVEWYKGGKYGILCNKGCFNHVPEVDCRYTRGDSGVQYTYIR